MASYLPLKSSRKGFLLSLVLVLGMILMMRILKGLEKRYQDLVIGVLDSKGNYQRMLISVSEVIGFELLLVGGHYPAIEGEALEYNGY